MTGFASAVDGSGDIYTVTGNGAFDADSGGRNYGESVVRIKPGLAKVVGYFTPTNWQNLNSNDADFGSGGIMLLPLQQGQPKALAVAMGKDSKLFLLDRARLGHARQGAADDRLARRRRLGRSGILQRAERSVRLLSDRRQRHARLATAAERRQSRR